MYDLENLLDDLITMVKANLNTKITAINTRKSDSISLAAIDDTAYALQNLDKAKAMAFDQFLFYGIDDPRTEGIGPETLEVHSLFFLIVVKNTAEDDNYVRRMLRYRQALKEIFQENYAKNPLGGRLIITSMAPVSFMAENFPSRFDVAGVKVEACLA